MWIFGDFPGYLCNSFEGVRLDLPVGPCVRLRQRTRFKDGKSHPYFLVLIAKVWNLVGRDVKARSVNETSRMLVFHGHYHTPGLRPVSA